VVPQEVPVTVSQGPVPVWDGGRFATSLLINNVYGVGLRVSYDYPLARRLFGGANALTLGGGLSYFHSTSYVDPDCYSAFYDDCQRESLALGLSATLGWRFGIGEYLELGPRTSLALWVSSYGGLMAFGGVGGSVRASRDSGMRVYFDLDLGHSDDVGGAMVMLGLGIGWGRGDPLGSRPARAPVPSVVGTRVATGGATHSAASAIHTGWRWTLSGQLADMVYGTALGVKMGLSLPLANHVLSDSSAITLGFEGGYFVEEEFFVASAFLGWRFGLGDHFELEPRVGLGLWGLGRSVTELVTVGSRLGIRPSVQSGFRIVIDSDVSRWHGRFNVFVASAGLGYAF